MPDASQYQLRVTAGPSYDTSTHHLVHVNTSKPAHIQSDRIDAKVHVRIKDYRGLPTGSPQSTPYFTHPSHKADLYSVSFSFRLRDPSSPTEPETPEDSDTSKDEQDHDHDQHQVQETSADNTGQIPGTSLLFGNDFSHPIHKNLPPGFGTAMRIVRWAIDPGLDGDVYAEEPYLYGPVLSSMNVLSIGDKNGESNDTAEDEKDDDDETSEEGGTASGLEIRKAHQIPADAANRKKFFLDETHRNNFSFESGREYKCDFFNGYLDFNNFALQLPGFHLPIMRYWDGQPLRYTLIHRTPDGSVTEPLLVIQFTLIPLDEVESEEKKWAVDRSAVDDAAATAPAPTEQGTAAPGLKNDKVDDEKGVDAPNYVDEGVD